MAITDAAARVKQIQDDHMTNTYLNVDVRLSTLLDMTFDSDDSHKDGMLSLTVVADGAVITGVIISEDAWAETQALKVEPTNPGFAASIRQLQEDSIEDRKSAHERIKDSDEHLPLRTKIHFEKATIMMGATAVEIAGLRVDLKHVSAWSIGEKTFPN